MTPEEKRAKRAAYMRAYLDDPEHPERREKKRAADRARAQANPEANVKRAQDWYWKNRDKALEKVAGYRKEIQEIAREAKNQPCMDCGGTFPYAAMHFHHRDPATKKGEVTNQGSIGSARKELAKCDVLCANCHYIRHAQENR